MLFEGRASDGAASNPSLPYSCEDVKADDEQVPSLKSREWCILWGTCLCARTTKGAHQVRPQQWSGSHGCCLQAARLGGDRGRPEPFPNASVVLTSSYKARELEFRKVFSTTRARLLVLELVSFGPPRRGQ